MAIGADNGGLKRLVANAAMRAGISPEMLMTFVKIESGGRPDTRTGSYKGLLQLSDSEFAKYGGHGDIFDPAANLNAGAQKLKAEMAMFRERYGREPTGSDLYMMHQQGWGGAQAHWSNPDQPAWKSMASTAEGRQKGEAWAKQAIWGNVPDDVKAQYGSVDNITSGQFTDLWKGKYARLGGQPAPVMTASAPVVAPEGIGGPAATPDTAPGKKGTQAVIPALASLFGLSLPGLGATATTAAAAAPTAAGGSTPALASLFGMGGGSGGGLPIGDTGLSIGGGGGDTAKMASAAAGMGGDEKEGAAPDPLAGLAGGVDLPQVDLQRLMAVLNKRRALGTGIA